jgi:ATP-dependent DNA helicase PIF1
VETGDNQAMAIGTEFFNTIILAGMPPHRLTFKVGVLVILLKNLDVASGLCNGTRLIIWRLAWRSIVTQIIGGMHAGNIFNIPRITMTTNRSKWPFTLQRCHFSLQLAFAMTINKAHGQTMKIVGIYLLELVFTHGQLYVALSRATHVNDVFIFCPNGRTTTNVVYTELLR